MSRVFVSGCFDLLHSGHVAFLESAALYGDLYVGIANGRSIERLKGRVPINTDSERLYMVSSLRCVKGAFINSGDGIVDFLKELDRVKPDIFYVNDDGVVPEKLEICSARGIRLVIDRRVPHPGLPTRSTTAVRAECRLPFRVELCGAWLDQPFVNTLAPGSVITASIHPDFDFNTRSGMATSSRNVAMGLWGLDLPAGDPEKNANILFCVENKPGSPEIAGSQDQLGILMPGINRLNYSSGYWPVSIDTIADDTSVSFLEDSLRLVQLKPRRKEYDVFSGKCITADSARLLSSASDAAWGAILDRDFERLGAAFTSCFAAQTKMFPAMITDEVADAIRRYSQISAGCKLTGAGGGGYLLVVAKSEIPGSLRIRVRR